MSRFTQEGQREKLTELPLDEPGGLAFDTSEKFYISDFWFGGIYQVTDQLEVPNFSDDSDHTATLIFNEQDSSLLVAEILDGYLGGTDIFRYLLQGEKSIVVQYPQLDIRYMVFDR